MHFLNIIHMPIKELEVYNLFHTSFQITISGLALLLLVKCGVFQAFPNDYKELEPREIIGITNSCPL